MNNHGPFEVDLLYTLARAGETQRLHRKSDGVCDRQNVGLFTLEAFQWKIIPSVDGAGHISLAVPGTNDYMYVQNSADVRWGTTSELKNASFTEVPALNRDPNYVSYQWMGGQGNRYLAGVGSEEVSARPFNPGTDDPDTFSWRKITSD